MKTNQQYYLVLNEYKRTVKSPHGIHIFLDLKFFFLELQEDLQKTKHI